MLAVTGLPIIDLSPFFKEGDEEGKKKAIDMISHACSEYGFFQVVNHGVSLELMNRALGLSKTFFADPEEEKLKISTNPDSPLPAGYSKQPERSRNRNEFISMFPPGSRFNLYPSNPPGFRDLMDEIFKIFVKAGRLLEGIINECLGLPPNFLAEYNNDRNWDILTNFHYYPKTETQNTGCYAHKDVNLITFVLQDEVGGLEFHKDGKWVPIAPLEGSLVVNLGDIVQVLSNDKFKSVLHRVVSQPGGDRYSYAFSYMPGTDKWVEPLPQLTRQINEAPRYKGFFFSEYMQLRLQDLKNPPPNPEDVITISHYAIPV